MPYGRKFRSSRYRRRRFSRKPLKRLARRTYRRRGARAQSRQIRTIARHLSSLKTTVKQDLTMTAIYQSAFQCPLRSTNNYCNDIIVPLTCGISQTLQEGHQPVTNLNINQTGPQLLSWQPRWQPRELKPNSGDANQAGVPPWIQVYRQSCTLKFWAGTVQQPEVITVSVVRVNPKVVANIKSIGKRLDGQDFEGPTPDLANQIDYIGKGQDYLSNDGLTFDQPPPGGAPSMPNRNPSGSMDLMWNKQLYVVEYQKQFTLGAALNPLRAHVAAPAQAPRPSYAPAQNYPDDNQFSETCKFSVSYGGMKLSSMPDLDSTTVNLDPMAATDCMYNQIPLEHKRWMVISSSNPHFGQDNYAPYIQMNSVISTKVPT